MEHMEIVKLVALIRTISCLIYITVYVFCFVYDKDGGVFAFFVLVFF